jgi:3-oxoacyl-(acyl-carrier-protein) synthase
MLENAGVGATEIDTINGHLTATTKDSLEIQNWCEALGRKGKSLYKLIKSMVGHCLSVLGLLKV